MPTRSEMDTGTISTNRGRLRARVRRRAGRVALVAAATCIAMSAATLSWAQDTPEPAGTNPATNPTSTAPIAPTGNDAATAAAALINQVLDAPITLDEQDQPLPEVLAAITATTGVPLSASDLTWQLVPYGRQTPISASVKDTSLRRTLDAITQKLGLRHELTDDGVVLRPLPALQRLGRRATLQEIAMLDLLASVDLNLTEPEPTVGELLATLDFELEKLDEIAVNADQPALGFKIENMLDDAANNERLFLPRDITILAAMEAVHRQTLGTWSPWGDTLVVQPKRGLFEERLNKPVDFSYERVDVQQVLVELQQAAGVPFRILPGSLQRVPEEYQQVRLYMENASVRDGLESLGALTGLTYNVDNEGVLIWNQFGGGSAVPTGAEGEQPLLLVDVGDGTSLLIYASDLPEDVRQRLVARRQAAVEHLRQTLPAASDSQRPGDRPTTPPADAPVAVQ